LQSVIPHHKHRKNDNFAYNTVSLDDIDIINEPKIIYQSKSNKSTDNLIDKYFSGNINRYSIKSAYIIIYTVKVLGTKYVKPANFGIFYDDLSNPCKGGTGHTMNICRHNKIEFIDQNVWFNWLN